MVIGMSGTKSDINNCKLGPRAVNVMPLCLFQGVVSVMVPTTMLQVSIALSIYGYVTYLLGR